MLYCFNDMKSLLLLMNRNELRIVDRIDIVSQTPPPILPIHEEKPTGAVARGHQNQRYKLLGCIFTVPSSKYSFTERIKLPIVPLTICDQLLSDSGKTITILQTNAIDTQSKEKKIHNPQQSRRIFESVYGNPFTNLKDQDHQKPRTFFPCFHPLAHRFRAECFSASMQANMHY
ncbi:unnamed protein product [Candida parapsilosis]